MSKVQQISIQGLNTDCEDWLRKIIFYQEELNSLNCSLLQVLKNSMINESRNEIEKFQKRLKDQGQKLNLILHNVKTKQEILTQFPKEHTIKSDDLLYNDHILLKNEYSEFESFFL